MKNTKTKKAIEKLQGIKVYQLENKNQYLIDSKDFRFFQSYGSLIAIYDKENRQLTVGSLWNYSNTTRKHLYIFIKDYCYIAQADAALSNTKNKRKALQKLIDEGVIFFDSTVQ